MNPIEVDQFWNNNAEAWTTLSRQGNDVYRDWVNTPAFLNMLPNIKGLKGLDIGCGEGSNTRKLAERGANMMAIDVAPAFLAYSLTQEQQDPRGILFQAASALDLPFGEATFDFATAFMSLMDIPDHAQAIREAHRVLKPGGFFQFSITHPCFNPPYRKSLKNSAGQEYAIAVGSYFDNIDGRIDEWMFSSIPSKQQQDWPKFRVPRFHLTLSEWLNRLIATGFMIEACSEPRVNDEVTTQCPAVADTQVVAYFLHIRCRKLS